MGINGVNLLQGQPPLWMRLLWLWAAVQVLSAELPDDEVPREVEGTTLDALCLVDLRWIYMKTHEFAGAILYNLDFVSRAFLGVMHNLWIFWLLSKKVGEV